MFFTPENPNFGLWDTWLFPEGDLFHLFYLRRDKRDVGCTVIGHAVSEDMVRWDSVRDALAVGAPPAWDSGPLMTGMVIKHSDGRYFMFYGSMIDGVQRIGVATSPDLYHWEKYAGNPIIEAAGPWYETDPSAAPNQETAWRDPCVVYDTEQGVYHAFICARVPGGSYTGGGCVAVCRSADLLHWELLPPAFVSDKHICLEVPDVFQMAGRYYMMYSTAYWFGSYYETHDPYVKNGTFYLVSDSMLEGWHDPGVDNILLGSREGRLDSYVGRSVAYHGQRLFYHHNVHGTIPNVNANGSFSSVKRLAVSESGQLTIEPLGRLSTYAASLATIENEAIGADRWTQDEDSYTASAGGPSALLIGAQQDMMATLNVQLADSANGAGLLMGLDCIPNQGLLAWLNAEDQTLDIGLLMRQGDRLVRAPPIHRRQASIARGENHSLHVVVYKRYLDVYVDNRLLVAFTWDLPPYGRTGLFAESGKTVFTDIQFSALHIS